MIIPVCGRKVNQSRPVGIGVKGDNLVNRLVFTGLPRIGEDQAAGLVWVSEEGTGDIAAMESVTEAKVSGMGITVGGALTRVRGRLTAYVEVTSGDTVWRSAPFAMYVTGLPEVPSGA